MRLAARVLLALFALACWLPGAASAAPAPTQAASDQTFRALGYGDQTGRGLDGSLDYFLALPGGQTPAAGSSLELDFSHSTLLVPDRSTLTVAVNGQSVQSVALTAANADHGRLSVPLPADAGSGDGLYVQALFELRLTTDACEPSQNPALWLTVHGDSTLHLAASGAADPPGLEHLKQLYTPVGGDPKSADRPLTLVLPRDPQPAEIAAAGLAAFAGAQWIGSAGKDPAIAVAHSVPADAPAIAVGSGGALPLAAGWGDLTWDGGAFTSPRGSAAKDAGVLALDRSATPRLLVSGATPTATLQAATALASPAAQPLLKGPAVTVAPAALPPAPDAPWAHDAASFAQLGIDRRQVAGPGEHDIELYVQRPPSWLLADGSALDLAVQTAPSLRQDTSWLGVTINGQDLGTRRLGGSSADRPQHIQFPLPVDVLNADVNGQPVRQLDIQLRFFLDLPQQGCVPMPPESAWAAVLPASALLLPHTAYSGLDLGRFPSPLDAAGLANVTVVLPAAPTDAELTSGLQVMAALGRWAPLDDAALPRLITADHLAAADRTHGLIVIGGPARNAASAALAVSAPDLFTLTTPALQPFGAGARGELHLAASPWARGQAVLALLADDQTALPMVARALTASATLGQLRGQSVAVTADLPPQTLLAAAPAEPAPASLTPRVTPNVATRLPAAQTAGAVLLGAFIVALVAVWLVRWRRSGKADG